jgi:hypothetical protein
MTNAYRVMKLKKKVMYSILQKKDPRADILVCPCEHIDRTLKPNISDRNNKRWLRIDISDLGNHQNKPDVPWSNQRHGKKKEKWISQAAMNPWIKTISLVISNSCFLKIPFIWQRFEMAWKIVMNTYFFIKNWVCLKKEPSAWTVVRSK